MKRIIEIFSSVLISILVLGMGSILYGQPEISWTRTYGGNGQDGGQMAKQTADGGYIILGRYNSSTTWLIKTDENGETIWTNTFDSHEFGIGADIEQIPDGGYIMCGTSGFYGDDNRDVWVTNLDSKGNFLWSKTIGVNGIDSGSDIDLTSDGGYVIVGRTESLVDSIESLGSENDGVLLIKLDSQGETMWERTYGGTRFDCGNAVQQTLDGGYIIIGNTYSSSSQFCEVDFDIWLIKVDNNGDTLWTKTYGSEGIDSGVDVMQTIDGGYLVVGSTEWDHMCFANGLMVKTDPDGNTQWMKTDSIYDYCAVQDMAGGGYVILAFHFEKCEDMRLVGTNENGDIEWTKNIEGMGVCGSLEKTNDGGFIITGRMNPLGESGYSDVWLIKIAGNLISTWYNPDDIPIRIYPNPVCDYLTVESDRPEQYSIMITNLNGQCLYRRTKDKGTLRINLTMNRTGVYFLTVKSKNYLITRKIIKQ